MTLVVNGRPGYTNLHRQTQSVDQQESLDVEISQTIDRPPELGYTAAMNVRPRLRRCFPLLQRNATLRIRFANFSNPSCTCLTSLRRIDSCGKDRVCCRNLVVD